MNKGYLYRKQSCGFNVKLEMLITAEESKEFGVEFEFEIDESTKLAISDGIKKVFDASELPPHEFTVFELIEHWKDTPPMGFEMCAQGAARLALGLSKVNASLPWGNSIPEHAMEELSFHSSKRATQKQHKQHRIGIQAVMLKRKFNINEDSKIHIYEVIFHQCTNQILLDIE